MSELRTIARHAGTLLVGQLAVMAFGVTDTIVAGRYDERALAALSVGAAVFASVFVALMGMLQALLPTWAELHGGERGHELGRSARQSLYLAFAILLFGEIVLLFPGPLLDWTEVPPPLQPDVRNYLAVLALALPAALLFRMYSTLNQSLGKPKLVTWLQAIALLVKIPLSIWFCFGGFGVPAMGAAGCATATVLVHWMLFGMGVWLLRTQDLYAPYAIWRRIEPPHWPTIWQFARIGIPGGLVMLVEVTSFTLMALFIARQGTLATAAHQVAANVAAVLFMTPLSIAVATSARVSYWLGARDPKLARLTIRTGFKLVLLFAFGYAALVLAARHGIAAIYSRDAAVSALAASLLPWLALFHVGDAAQALCVFVLRCYRVVVAPLVAYTVTLWGLGLAGGFVLAYRGIGPWPAQNSPHAFWMAASIALVALALILPLILWRAVRRYRPPT